MFKKSNSGNERNNLLPRFCDIDGHGSHGGDKAGEHTGQEVAEDPIIHISWNEKKTKTISKLFNEEK